MGEPDRDVDAGRVDRRRQLVLTGAAVVVLVLVGIGGVNVLRNDPGGPPPASDRAAAPGVSVPYAAPDATQEPVQPDTPYMQLPPGTAAPPEPWSPGPSGAPAAAVPPAAGGANAAPLGPGTGECADRQDPALRALVDEALPEVVGAREAATTLECRPGGERGVALEVDGGVLTVTYLPPGPVATAPDGAQTASTASGGTLVLVSRAERAGDPAPFADRFQAMVVYLAPRL